MAQASSPTTNPQPPTTNYRSPTANLVQTLKLTLAYDGTDFVGWQLQTNGTSIQELLEAALSQIDGQPVKVTGAGRTDAGVHALGQVASVQIDHPIEPATLARALNASLPTSIRVLEARQVRDSFNARFDATGKTYVYRILNEPVALPFERFYAWHHPWALSLETMQRASTGLEGAHDFSAFQGAGSDVASSIRTLSRIEIRLESPSERVIHAFSHRPSRVIRVELTGDGFLRHMVRNIVGTLVEIGTNRRMPEELTAILESRDRGRAGPTAPACGLFLMEVAYRENNP